MPADGEKDKETTNKAQGRIPWVETTDELVDARVLYIYMYVYNITSSARVVSGVCETGEGLAHGKMADERRHNIIYIPRFENIHSNYITI